jgi:hypothetical protein
MYLRKRNESARLKKINVVNPENNTAVTMMAMCYCNCGCSSNDDHSDAYNANLYNISNLKN